MKKQMAAGFISALLALTLVFAALMPLGVFAEGKLLFNSNDIDAKTRETFKNALVFKEIDIKDVENNPDHALVLDEAATLSNLCEIYSNIYEVKLLGSLVYPDEPAVGANEIDVSNMTLMIKHEDPDIGGELNYPLGGFTGYAIAYLIGGEAIETTKSETTSEETTPEETTPEETTSEETTPEETTLEETTLEETTLEETTPEETTPEETTPEETTSEETTPEETTPGETTPEETTLEETTPEETTLEETTSEETTPTEPEIIDVFIKVNDLEITYGEALDLTYDADTLPSGITLGGTPSYSIAGTPDVGEYEVAISGLSLSGDGSENYRINYINGTLTVNVRKISVAVKNQSTVYGEAAPSFEITLSDGTLAVGERLATVLGDLEYFCAYEIGMPVLDEGYSIGLAAYTVNKNYEIVSVQNGILTVEPRTLYVFPEAAEKYENSADPEFVCSFSGNFYIETPEFSGALSRESGESVGSYAFTLGTLQLEDNTPFYAKNYVLALDPQAPKFEIKQEPFAIRLSSVSLTLRDKVHIAYKLETGSELADTEILSFGVLEWSAYEYLSLESCTYEDNLPYAHAGERLDGFTEGRGILPFEYMQSFFCVAYAETENGYIYSEPLEYSVAEYAKYIFENYEEYESVLSLLISMLDYGTAVMNYCGIEVEKYPNELIPDALRGGEIYRDELAQNAKNAAAEAKNAEISVKDTETLSLGTQGIAVDLHECLSLRISVTLDPSDAKRTVKLYYWNTRDIIPDKDGKIILDPEKASVAVAEENGNKYTAIIDGIVPARAGEVYYTVFAVEDGQTIMFCPIKVCGADFYAAALTEYYSEGVTNSLARALLVYTSEAQKYLATEDD